MNSVDSKSNKGFTIIGSIALITLIFIGLVVLLLLVCELNKAYWDYRVSQMCKEDGGVEIYEHVEVASEDLAQLPRVGENIAFRFKQEAILSGDIIYFDYKSSELRPSFPRINRYEKNIYLTSSGEKVAKTTQYSRVGSDFPIGLGPDSSFICPPSTQVTSAREKIFVIREK